MNKHFPDSASFILPNCMNKKKNQSAGCKISDFLSWRKKLLRSFEQKVQSFSAKRCEVLDSLTGVCESAFKWDDFFFFFFLLEIFCVCLQPRMTDMICATGLYRGSLWMTVSGEKRFYKPRGSFWRSRATDWGASFSSCHETKKNIQNNSKEGLNNFRKYSALSENVKEKGKMDYCCLIIHSSDCS